MTLTRKEKEQLVRRNLILDAAEELFSRDGYENASMNEIAKLSEFTKRTLYQYFDDKADLYLSVLLKLYSDMYEHLTTIDYKYLDGFDLVKKSLYAYYDYFKTHEKTFKILYDIGKVRNLTVNNKIDEFIKIDNLITKSLSESIQLGQKDGSITKRVDYTTMSLNLKFLLTSLFNQLTISGKSYAKHINKTMDEFAYSLLDIILDTIK